MVNVHELKRPKNFHETILTHPDRPQASQTHRDDVKMAEVTVACWRQDFVSRIQKNHTEGQQFAKGSCFFLQCFMASFHALTTFQVQKCILVPRPQVPSRGTSAVTRGASQSVSVQTFLGGQGDRSYFGTQAYLNSNPTNLLAQGSLGLYFLGNGSTSMSSQAKEARSIKN